MKVQSFFASCVVALCVSTSIGCGGGKLDVDGAITPAAGKTAPESAAVQVVWTISSGSPDYSYVFGSGSATNTSFDLSFAADPPEEALNNYGLGVGVLVLVSEADKVEEKKYEKGELGRVPRFP